MAYVTTSITSLLDSTNKHRTSRLQSKFESRQCTPHRASCLLASAAADRLVNLQLHAHGLVEPLYALPGWQENNGNYPSLGSVRLEE